MPSMTDRRRLNNKVNAQGASSMQQLAAASNLFAACLPRWLDNTQLLSVFAAFEPTSATIMMDVNTGRSKGFGFVLFRSDEEGQRALNALNGKSVSCGGATFAMHLSPSKFDGSAACAESTRIYVRNVPWAMCADEVAEYFSRHGAVKAIEMRPDATESSWLVTLEYSSIAEAKTAINHSHGKYLFPDLANNGKPIMAKFASSRAPTARSVKDTPLSVALEPNCGASSSEGTSEVDSLDSSRSLQSSLRTYRHDPYSETAFCWM